MDYHHNIKKFLRAKIAHVFVLLILVLAVNHVTFSYLLMHREIARADDFVGLAAVGSNIYPRDNLQLLATLNLPADLKNVQFALVDASNSLLYVASNNEDNQSSILAKFDLTNWKRLADLPLDDYVMVSGNIDFQNGFIYLGIKKQLETAMDYKIAKVDLQNFIFSETVTLEPEDGEAINQPKLDTLNNILYLIRSDIQGTYLLKIDVQPDKFQRIGAITLENTSGILTNANSVILQPQKNGGYLYVANQQKIAKVDLAKFKLSGFLTDKDNGIYKLLGVDQDLGYLYYYNKYNYKYSQLKRVNLADFSIDRIILNLNTTDDCVAMAIDNDDIISHSAYIVTLLNDLTPTDPDKKDSSIFYTVSNSSAQYKIIKINLINFSRQDKIDLSLGQSEFKSLLSDYDNGYLYLISTGSTNYLTKIDIGRDRVFKEVEKLKLISGQKKITVGVADANLGQAFFAVQQEENEPRKIIKVDIATFTKIGELDLLANEKEIVAAVVDPFNHLAYFASDSGIIIKIDLVKFERVATVSLGTSNLSATAVDLDKKFAYFSTNTVPAKLFKVSIDPNSFKLVASLTASFNGNQSLLIDTKNNLAYLADNDRLAGHVSKIDLGTFTILETISTGNHLQYKNAFFDKNKQNAYFLTDKDEFVRIDLQNFKYSDIFTPPLEFTDISNAAGDSGSNYLYYIANKGRYSRLIKFNLQAGDLGVREYVDLPYLNQPVQAMIIDDAKAEMYLGTSGHLLYKISYSPLKGKIKAFKVNIKKDGLKVNYFEIYSHQAVGNIRLGLYDSKKNLIWQSKSISNTASNNWLKIDIADRSRRYLATLKAGDYWLAFQTDAIDDIASYSPGLMGSGWELPYKFGLFPTSIINEKPNSENWSIYGTQK
jgi:DNA-binding beta-propeller fold protein YncE